MYSQLMNIVLVHWCTGGEADIHSTKVTILWLSLKKQTHEMHVLRNLRPFFAKHFVRVSIFPFFFTLQLVRFVILFCRCNIVWLCFIGHGLTVQHFRMNSECGRLEELPPIDQNLQYDFDYQQTVHLPAERTVLPVRYCIMIWPAYMNHS